MTSKNQKPNIVIANASSLGGLPVTQLDENGKRKYFVNKQASIYANGFNFGHPVVVKQGGQHFNSVLRKDEWEALDDRVQVAASDPLRGIKGLIDMGLTQQYNSIGVQMSQYNQVGEMPAAHVTMDGASRGGRGQLDFQLVSVPLPVTHLDYSYTTRTLESARLMGGGFDTAYAEQTAKSVGQTIEGMLYTGYPTIQVNGSTIYGYTTEPNRNTGSGSDWGTISNILPFVEAMITAANNDGYYGPFDLYVPTTQYNEATAYFTDGSGQTALDRILNKPQIRAVHQVPENFLSSGNIVLAQLTRDVVDLAFVNGFGITVTGEGDTQVQGAVNLEWQSGDTMNNFFKVASIMVPRVKSDRDGNSGIVHYTGA